MEITQNEERPRIESDLQEIADRLHAKALKAQEDGVAMDMKRGRSRSRAESVRDAWGVTVRSGDLLRILEVVSRG